MNLGLFFKIFVAVLCVVFTWYNFNTISKNPFLVLISGSLFISLYFLVSSCKNISLKSLKKNLYEKRESGFELFLNHPAKMIVVYLAFLSLLGGSLLSLPFLQDEPVAIVDAFFIAVSATCVTGLASVDIGSTFSFLGQIIILILIQLGGLGIMSIASIAVYNVGKISLKHEVILTSDITDDMGALKKALIRIGKVTFLAEFIGAVILSILFYINGENGFIGVYKGIFTAISAFCNAGLTLDANSLELYKNVPLVLHVITILIITGGFSPATVVLFPKFLTRKKISPQAKIAIVTTLSLLSVGFISFLFLEWSGMLNGLSFVDKVNNAWFLSASTRTAGFLSVDLLQTRDVTYIMILFFMFIGGNPGSIAGGIKTTTFAILILTFLTTISNKRSIVVESKEIRKDTVYKAVTIVISTLLILFLVFVMLITTQNLPIKALLFEAVSALATTGLSLNTTSRLDEIGKVIIMFAMFIGRVGPLTLLTILRGKQSLDISQYPPAKISLT